MREVRAFKHRQDYPILCEWWKHWGHPLAPKDELSNTGYMVYLENKPILCGFLILTNAKFAMLETVCAAPGTTIEERTEGIIFLVSAIAKTAKELGFRRVLGFPKKTRLMEKVKLAGFACAEQQAYYCVKEL